MAASHQSANAQLTWQVQSDYFGERNAIAQPRTTRGLSLSPDETSVYHGNIQSPNTGSTALRKVKSIVLAIPGTDTFIFGNGMPGGTGTFGQVGGQPVYAGGATGTFEAWTDVGNSPESLDTDDRGYVYAALSSGISSANAVVIYTADLATQVGQLNRTRPTGVAVRNLGGTYYAYVISGDGLHRFDVTTVFPASPDPAWNPPIFDTGLTSGRSLDVDADGTVFVAGDNLVRRVSPDGTTITHSVSIPSAADVAIFQDKIYVTRRTSPTAAIVVLNKADLSSGGPDIVTPDLGVAVSRPRGTISQFTSIDISHDGRVFVSEENYTSGANGIPSYTPPATSFNPMPGTIIGRIYFDRILVSSRLPDVEAPVITCPANITRPADAGQCTAVVNPGVATAVDGVDGPIPATSISGVRSDLLALTDPYPVGTTTITWTAVDSSNNASTCPQTVTVIDIEPPTITCPGSFTVSADPGQCTKVVAAYPAVMVSDNCPGVGTPVFNPPAGSTLALGPNTINVMVTDAANNTNSCSFVITVIDIEPPTITCPGNYTVPTDPGQCTAVVAAYPAVTVGDNCPGVGAPVFNLPVGSTLALGPNTINVMVTDASNNVNSCSFVITVKDMEAPTIACPMAITASATGPGGAIVTFAPTVADNCDPNPSVVCTPPSGTLFPIGTTTVNCVATDAAGNSQSCSFTVTVVNQAPRAIKLDVLSQLQTIRAGVTDKEDKNKLDDSISHLTKSVAIANWNDDSHPKPGSKGEAVFNEEKPVVNNLKALRKSNDSGLSVALLQGLINTLVGADRDLAEIAISEAMARNGDPGKINNANTQLSKGDVQASKDYPDKAIDAYKNSWKYAIGA